MVSYQLFQYATPDEVAKVCSTALKHRLFVNTWCLRDDLRYFKDDPTLGVGRLKIALAYHNKDPIGIIFSDRGQVSAFVRKSFRRQGVASNGILFGQFQIERCGEGIKGSYEFWAKMRHKTRLFSEGE